MKGIDKKDERILTELTNNCRKPLTQISKDVKLSRQTTEYRIKRLQNRRFIDKFTCLIDLKKLNIYEAGFFFRLHSVDEEKNKEIREYIQSHPLTGWSGEGIGTWNLITDIFGNDYNECESIIEKFFDEFGDYVYDYGLHPIESSNYWFYKYFTNEGKDKKKKKAKVKIDALDIKILEILSKNARTKLTDMAKNFDITPNSVNNRIKKMKENGVINGFTTMINFQKLGYNLHDFFIEYDYRSRNEEEKFINFLKSFPGVIYCYKFIPGWFEVGIVGKGVEDVRPLLMQLRGKFRERIKIKQFHLAFNLFKQTITPKGVFEKLRENKGRV